MFLQEWPMMMNMNVPLTVLSISADCGRSGPVVSLHKQD